MRLISIHVYKSLAEQQPILLSSAYNLSFCGFFEKGTVKEFINFHSRLVVSRTNKEERQEITLEKGLCYSYVSSDRIGISIITDEEYPKRVAFDLIYKIIQQFSEFVFTNKLNLELITKDTDVKFKFIDKLIEEWQNPKESK